MFAASKTASVSGGYQISRSLRFNSADSTNLNRTPSVAANQQIWTFSIWLKRSRIGADYEGIFSSGNGTDQIRFENNDVFRFGLNGSTAADFLTTQVFRDVSAWYHIVVAVDTTQATASNRVKIYVNGSQVTSFSTANYPSQNYNTFFNNTADHRIGSAGTSAYYFNGYITEFNWVCGLQLTPSSFGQTDAQTGVWTPIAYSGSYGTNGFYLNFSDNSNTTAATLGKDYSGNGNNWTPNNFSVTAGAGNDSLVDSPTSYGTDTGVGGTVRGNYATLNPLSVLIGTTSNGNLDGDTGTTNGGVVYATINIPNSGKWYWEYTQTNTGTSYSGIETVVSSTSASIPNNVWYIGDGTKQVNGTTTSYGASYGNTDIIGTAIDVDAGTVTFYKNGTSQGAITYATASINVSPSWRDGSGSVSLSFNANFGQRPFAYTAPSGYKALCTQNLPTPTIGATTATQAGKYFNPVLYTGNGSSRSITGLGFQPDFTWIKARSVAYSHRLADSVRGAGKELYSDDTAAETTNSSNGYVTSFDSDGFSLGTGIGVNANTQTFVAWNWKANGSGSTNTAGTVTSTVSANTTSGFSVVTYTGNGTVGATVGHGLGVAPSMMFIKGRTNVDNWHVYSSALGNTGGLFLNLTSAFTVSTYFWNNTSPTSTVFTLSSGSSNNSSGVNYVCYAFSEVAGYSKFGSYVGNGSTSGPFIYTGFRPRFVMIKIASGPTYNTDNWFMFDTARGPYNDNNPYLLANTSGAEGAFTSPEMLSNGFLVNTISNALNYNGSTFIYMAFAESPFKYSLAR